MTPSPRWLGRLRPQGHGHHRSWGVESVKRHFRDGHRHPDGGLHLRRHRRHERRRRSATACCAPNTSASSRGVRPPARLHRPHPGRSDLVCRAAAAVRAPRSSWADYDASLISAGGGVFARSAKSVAITPEMITVLGLPADTTSMTRADLINAVLKAPVDLPRNGGGIGTYVKASSEGNAAAGDRANDAVRSMAGN
ncbi:MAG: NAD-glutamate dehydrogenase [Actinomycetales bacterium]|nr:NAD-glutamate dehydrogenase [Actinomycetales bacterium]